VAEGVVLRDLRRPEPDGGFAERFAQCAHRLGLGWELRHQRVHIFARFFHRFNEFGIVEIFA